MSEENEVVEEVAETPDPVEEQLEPVDPEPAADEESEDEVVTEDDLVTEPTEEERKAAIRRNMSMNMVKKRK
jgi:hypothetical protein